MTVSTTIAGQSFPGNGVQTLFAYTFELPFQADGVTPAVEAYTLVAGVVTKLVYNVDFSLTGVGVPGGGSMTFPISGSPLAAGGIIVLLRNKSLSQDSAFPNMSFYPPSVETALDTLTLEFQQLSFLFPVGPFVVAGLPPAGIIGRRTYVTDATAPTFLGTLTGGGTVITPVFDNGTAWVAG